MSGLEMPTPKPRSDSDLSLLRAAQQASAGAYTSQGVPSPGLASSSSAATGGRRPVGLARPAASPAKSAASPAPSPKPPKRVPHTVASQACAATLWGASI